MDGMMEERLKAHSCLFSSMVELIPPSVYITKEDPDSEEEFEGGKTSKFWVKKKRDEKKPKISWKEASKRAKRLRLDPENRKSVAELQLEASAGRGDGGGDIKEMETEEDHSNDDNSSVRPLVVKNFSVERVRSISYDALQERLREKMRNIQRKRKAGEIDEEVDEKTAKERAQKRQKRIETRKRKKEQRQKEKLAKKKGSKNTSGKAERPRAPFARPSVTDENGRVVFSKFDFSTSASHEHPSTETSSSKKKDYKKLLAKAEAEQKKLEEMKLNDEKRGDELARKLMWKKAVDMAKGTKLKDDPKLLKRSAKRIDKKKKVSAKEWEERKKAETDMKEKRQTKRKANIEQRKEQIKSKRIKKRNKKGKGRTPGF